MEKSGEAHWTELLLKILADIEAGKLSTRFSAVEARSGGGDELVIYSPELHGQLNYEGYLNRDLDVLGNAGYLDVAFSGLESRDVVVLQKAFDFKKEANAPRWKRTARRALPATSAVKYGIAIVAGAVLNQFGNSVVWPWLQHLFGGH